MIKAFSSAQDSRQRRLLMVHMVSIPQLNKYWKMSNAKSAEYNIFSPIELLYHMDLLYGSYVHTTLEMAISECNKTISSLIVQTVFPKCKRHNWLYRVFFIKKPGNPTAQSQTFSSYIQHNIFKALVCISPSGAITYISKLWRRGGGYGI